jgi:tetratricopeptide (TPR) repeat protein
MNKLFAKISVFLVIMMFLACGPKPHVEIQPLDTTELKEKPINPVAFYHYMSGVISELEENYELAISYYTSALQHAPESYDIRIALAKLRMGLREFDKAWELLEPLNNLYAEAVLMKADCQRSLGDWPQAIKFYEMAARLDPHEMSPFWYLGNYYRQTGNFEEAIKYYERMIRMSDNTQIYNELALLYLAAGDTDKSMEMYQASLMIDSSTDNGESYLALAKLLDQTGSPDSAQIVLENYIERSSGSINARLQLIGMLVKAGKTDEAYKEIVILGEEFPNRSRLQGELGALCLDLNQIDQARIYFERQIELDPENFFPLYYLGRISLFESDMEAAKSYFWKVIDVVDSIPDGWINLAEVYRSQDSLDMAVDVMRSGLERVTVGREDLNVFLARYYSQQENYLGVINILNGVTDSTTTDVSVIFMHASACERVGQFDQAVSFFRQLLTLEPEFHPALNYLGYMFADSGINLIEAKEMIERSLAQDSANPAYMDSYGWVLFKMGKLSEAEKYIKQSMELMKDHKPDVIIYDHLAEIYYAQGRKEAAREIWEKALGIDPNNLAIKEKLDR